MYCLRVHIYGIKQENDEYSISSGLGVAVSKVRGEAHGEMQVSSNGLGFLNLLL
jgi:hypothetical protein